MTNKTPKWEPLPEDVPQSLRIPATPARARPKPETMLVPHSHDIPYMGNQPLPYWTLWDINMAPIWVWNAADDHIPCWFDFIPNRNAAVQYTLEYTGSEGIFKWKLDAGPLRQEVKRGMEYLEGVISHA